MHVIDGLESSCTYSACAVMLQYVPSLPRGISFDGDRVGLWVGIPRECPESALCLVITGISWKFSPRRAIGNNPEIDKTP